MWSCGKERGLSFIFPLFFPSPSLLFCIITTFVFSIDPYHCRITWPTQCQTLPAHYSLWVRDALIDNFSPGSSTVCVRATHRVKYSPQGSKVVVTRVRGGLGPEPYSHTFWQVPSVLSHGPTLDHKALLAPDLTCSSSLSCKSLLASHCAVFQTTVSSDDCAINTSMNSCYPYVASIYVHLSNVTIHPYLHCGGDNRVLLLFIDVIKHHP